MWVARDKNGELMLVTTKPIRNYESNCWRVSDTSDCTDWMLLNELLFPDLTWDNEPIEVDLVFANVNEDELQDEADMFAEQFDDPSWDDIAEAFKAGYHKAKEK